MNKQPEITKQTKQNIIDAFWQLYCVKRIDKITVREITLKAGYNRGTFYEYFADVYDVLEQIETSLLPELDELPPLNFSPAPAEPIDDFIKMYTDNSKYYNVLLGDGGDPSFQGRLKSYIKHKLKQMLIETGTADGFELDYTLEYTLSAMIGVLNYWFRQENTPPTDKLLNLMREIMDNGVMSRFQKL